jgi:two-component system, LytTR family, response regulator
MKNKHSVIVLEDEIPAQNLLKSYIEARIDLDLIGIYADGYSGCKAINELKPDLVVLDIQMPKLNGIEVAELMEHRPAVVFCTAYDHFAAQAFELSAADYVLKPYSKERLDAAINKALAPLAHPPTKKLAEEDLSALMPPENLQRVAVRSGSKIHVVACSEIDYMESDGDYVAIKAGSARYLKEKTMKYYEEKLDASKFLRIHRSYLANVDKICRIEIFGKDQHIVVMENGDKIKSSASGYKLLRQVLDI